MSDQFDDHLRNALRAEADDVSAGPELLDHIHASSHGGGSAWRRSQAWLIAAAVLALVAGLAAVLLNGSDDQTLDVVDDPSTSSTSPIEDLLRDGSVTIPCRPGEDPDLAVYMQPTASDADLAAMDDTLASDPRVAAQRYVSRRETYESFQQTFADQPGLLETVTPDILPTSYVITLQDAVDKSGLHAELGGAPGVYEVADVGCATVGALALPTQVVAVTERGHIVVIDTATGGVIRDLGGLDDPTDPAIQARPGGPFSITGVALHPNGRDVYFETCCEPAGGTIFRVPIDGSVPIDASQLVPVASGYGIDISADGRWLAFVSGPMIGVLDLATTEQPRYVESGEGSHEWVQVAINRDGTELAIERVLERSGDARQVLRSDVRTIMIADGTYEDVPVAKGRFIPVWINGTMLASAPAPGADPRDSNIDGSGTWIIEVSSDGMLTGRGDGDVTIPGGPFTAADW
jgi:hypothetical protein